MKLVCSRIACIAALLFTLALAATAAPPTLTPSPNSPLPRTSKSGESLTFDLIYQQEAGDQPLAGSLALIVTPPNGPALKPILPTRTSGDPASGEEIVWNFTPEDSGTYHYHFEALSEAKQQARYPEAAGDTVELTVPNEGLKYLTLIGGMAICLICLPFIVYVAARAINKQGNPATVARVALMVGVVLSYILFAFLFGQGNLVIYACGALVAIGILVALLTRK